MVIGLTGNIGTGKSLVAEFFKKWGAFIISGDQIGWEVLKSTDIKEKLKNTFGEKIIKDNEVDREKLGNIVFSDTNKLRKLNKIVHPILLKKLRKAISESNEDTIVVDAALVFEWDIKDWFDYTILTVSKLSNIKSRLKKLGISNKIIYGTLKSQMNPEKAKIYADFVIFNNGSKKELREKAQKVWDKILRKNQ
jgi:dephospho-CoA kinase